MLQSSFLLFTRFSRVPRGREWAFQQCVVTMGRGIVFIPRDRLNRIDSILEESWLRNFVVHRRLPFQNLPKMGLHAMGKIAMKVPPVSPVLPAGHTARAEAGPRARTPAPPSSPTGCIRAGNKRGPSPSQAPADDDVRATKQARFSASIIATPERPADRSISPAPCALPLGIERP